MRRFLLSGLILLAAAGNAAAQESGGLSLSPEALAAGGPRGLARPLPFTLPGFTASDLQVTPTPAERRSQHQQMIARLRGDGGFLDGFAFGQPLAASRQPPPPPVDPVVVPLFLDQRTRIVNRFQAPVAVTVGDNIVVQQQGARGDGPTAQQQVATLGGQARRGSGHGAANGASNLVTADGNIIQRAPGTRPRHRRTVSMAQGGATAPSLPRGHAAGTAGPHPPGR